MEKVFYLLLITAGTIVAADTTSRQELYNQLQEHLINLELQHSGDARLEISCLSQQLEQIDWSAAAYNNEALAHDLNNLLSGRITLQKLGERLQSHQLQGNQLAEIASNYLQSPTDHSDNTAKLLVTYCALAALHYATIGEKPTATRLASFCSGTAACYALGRQAGLLHPLITPHDGQHTDTDSDSEDEDESLIGPNTRYVLNQISNASSSLLATLHTPSAANAPRPRQPRSRFMPADW